MAKNALSRAERQRQIMTALQLDWQKNGDGHGLTVADFARIMQVAVSHKLRLLVTELAVKELVKQTKLAIPGVCGFKIVYTLPDGSEWRQGGVVKAERVITINFRNNQQTMLWGE